MTHMPTTFDRPTLAMPHGARPDALGLGGAGLRPTPADAIPVHDAGALTQGGPVAHIRLDGQVYTLRITRQGKLILTK